MRVLLALCALPLASFAEPAAPPPMIYTNLTVPSPFRGSFETFPLIECVGARGTGVRVSDDIVITARHVVDSRGPCGIEGVPVEIAYHQPRFDFTALRANLGVGYRAIVSCEGIKPGERYYAYGYANGGKPNMEPLIGTNQVDGGAVMLRGKVYPGMSGGAVTTSEGAVVALTTMRHKEADWAYVVPLSSTYLCRSAA